MNKTLIASPSNSTSSYVNVFILPHAGGVANSYANAFPECDFNAYVCEYQAEDFVERRSCNVNWGVGKMHWNPLYPSLIGLTCCSDTAWVRSSRSSCVARWNAKNILYLYLLFCHPHHRILVIPSCNVLMLSRRCVNKVGGWVIKPRRLLLCFPISRSTKSTCPQRLLSFPHHVFSSLQRMTRQYRNLSSRTSGVVTSRSRMILSSCRLPRIISILSNRPRVRWIWYVARYGHCFPRADLCAFRAVLSEYVSLSLSLSLISPTPTPHLNRHIWHARWNDRFGRFENSTTSCFQGVIVDGSIELTHAQVVSRAMSLAYVQQSLFPPQKSLLFTCPHLRIGSSLRWVFFLRVRRFNPFTTRTRLISWSILQGMYTSSDSHDEIVCETCSFISSSSLDFVDDEKNLPDDASIRHPNRLLTSCGVPWRADPRENPSIGCTRRIVAKLFLRKWSYHERTRSDVCDGCNLFFVWECLRGLVFGYRTGVSNITFRCHHSNIIQQVPLWFPTMSWSIRNVSLLIFLVTRSQESCSHHHNFETFWTIRISILRPVSHRFDISIYVVRSYLPHLPNDSRLVFLSRRFGTTTVRGSPWMFRMRNYRTTHRWRFLDLPLLENLHPVWPVVSWIPRRWNLYVLFLLTLQHITKKWLTPTTPTQVPLGIPVIFTSPHLTCQSDTSQIRSRPRIRFYELDEKTYYNTGDRARILDDGSLELMGRKDDTIKIRGFKVPLPLVRAGVRASISNVSSVVIHYLLNRDSSTEKSRCVCSVWQHDRSSASVYVFFTFSFTSHNSIVTISHNSMQQLLTSQL